jgi:hypothetical protein
LSLKSKFLNSGEFIGGQDDRHTLGSADDGTSRALADDIDAPAGH